MSGSSATALRLDEKPSAAPVARALSVLRTTNGSRLGVAPVLAEAPVGVAAPAVQDDGTASLVDLLSAALRAAVPLTRDLDDATSKVRTTYRDVAVIVVDLRHRFHGPTGEEHDLRGRSREYRIAVRAAYEGAGVDPNTRVARRITVGVAYWVRIILLQRYSQEELVRLGVIARSARQSWKMSDTPTAGPDDVMSIALGMLNELAADASYVPRREAMASLLRASVLLRRRAEPGADRVDSVA